VKAVCVARRILRVDLVRFLGFAAATTGGAGGGFFGFAFFAVCLTSTGGRVFANMAARDLTVVFVRFRLAGVATLVGPRRAGSARRSAACFARNRSTSSRTSSTS